MPGTSATVGEAVLVLGGRRVLPLSAVVTTNAPLSSSSSTTSTTHTRPLDKPSLLFMKCPPFCRSYRRRPSSPRTQTAPSSSSPTTKVSDESATIWLRNSLVWSGRLLFRLKWMTFSLYCRLFKRANFFFRRAPSLLSPIGRRRRGDVRLRRRQRRLESGGGRARRLPRHAAYDVVKE